MVISKKLKLMGIMFKENIQQIYTMVANSLHVDLSNGLDVDR